MFSYTPRTTAPSMATFWEEHRPTLYCYNYASLFANDYVEPGTRFSTKIPRYAINGFKTLTTTGLHSALLYDGWEHVHHHGTNIPAIRNTHYLIAAFVGRQTYDYNAMYHFFRQDPDGIWSHKNGHTNVYRTNQEGTRLENPIIQHGSHMDLVGLYAGPKTGIWRQWRSDLLALPTPRKQQELDIPVPALNGR